MNKEYLLVLQRLGVICLMYKDKFGAGMLMPSMFQDSRITMISKLLTLVNNNWLPLQLSRFIPEEISPVLFHEWLNETKIAYLRKESYLTMTYKNLLHDSTRMIELPTIGKIERLCNMKVRIYYNLIPDIVMHILQHNIIKHPGSMFPTKFHFFCISCEWDDIHNSVLEAYKKFLYTGEENVSSS